MTPYHDVNKHLAAQHAFKDAVARHLPDLVHVMHEDGVPLSSKVNAMTAVRIARRSESLPVGNALERFETAIRAALVAYLDATPKAAQKVLTAEALFLQEHFDRFTEVPVTATWVQRVVIWARRNYRAWRKADREQARTDRS